MSARSEAEDSVDPEASPDANREIYREIEVELPTDDTLPFVQVLDEGQALPDLSGYYEVLYDENRPQSEKDLARLVLYFPIHCELATAQVELVLNALGLERFQIGEKRIERQDYLQAYKQYYEPFQISSRLLIVPSWDRGGERERELQSSLQTQAGREFRSLYLDPGLAFGTGKHPTTELCLQYLDDAFAARDSDAPRDIIDAGAGSGILSIGALLLGARRVYAFDVDGNAAIACEQNLALNPGIGGELRFERGGFDLPGFADFSADLMLGNLTATVLLQNQQFIDRARVKRMVLSGILSEQQDQVIAAFESGCWRLAPDGIREKDGWVLLEFESAAV
ncbi:MAG: 50S ribosomal protein L11 methyltransferase [bacterium]|nr:50S ribosomal protein L11 methyltransferase [bacterium]